MAASGEGQGCVRAARYIFCCRYHSNVPQQQKLASCLAFFKCADNRLKLRPHNHHRTTITPLANGSLD